MGQHGTIIRGTYDSPISSLSKYPCPEWNRMDINGLRDAVRPSLAKFLSIGARRQRPGLLFHTSRVLLTTPKRKRKKNDGRAVRMASSRSMSFANASRNKIFETRARILALAYIRCTFPFRYQPPFAHFLSSRPL